MRPTTLVVCAGIAAIVLAGLAACGGGSSDRVASTEWADSICGSLSEWKRSIASLADVSGGELTKDALREKLDAAQAATTKLTTDLHELGPPDLEAGDDVKRELDDSATTLENAYRELQAGAQDALDASDAAGFLRALADLAPTYQRLLDRIAQTVETLQDVNLAPEARTELQQAFRDAESCQALGADG